MTGDFAGQCADHLYRVFGMLSCSELSVRADGSDFVILDHINAHFPNRSLNALVGPSGCGKTTLIKAFLGLVNSEGEIAHREQSSSESSSNQRLGFVPQFSVAHASLTVEESLAYAFDLTVSDLSAKADTLASVLKLIGLDEHGEKRVSSLSGGQMRRLGLGLELVSSPECLICDEVTSGLDPLSEDQIIALLRSLVLEHEKTFICTIHNLGKLPDFDHITVLYQGRLVFQGDFNGLQSWFGIEDPLRLYHALSGHELSHWLEKWENRGVSACGRPTEERSDRGDSIPVGSQEAQQVEVAEATRDEKLDPGNARLPSGTTVGSTATVRRAQIGAESCNPGLPSALSQLFTLLRRRYKLLMRDTGYLWLLLALTFGFPCIVVIFAIKGLPQIEGLALERSGSFIQQLQGDLRYRMEAAETATLVTGLVMFQVVLLTLMGANNGAREIAGERQIFEKERLKGLRSGMYTLSKLLFTGSIAALQGLWMALFVKVICQFPGAFLPQLGMMALCCVAMTFVCLGMSAVLSSAERASLLSIYLVGFQLPLSGVVLALPDAVVWLLRPFINAYWSWAGYFASMKDFQLYDAYRMGNVSWLPSEWGAATVLFLHIAAGAALVFYGCGKTRWDSAS
ncbi:ATP-binding cassette domain-containing protein [Coraliomargarita sp. SDUM461004]|uniref:ATP-binding cassette domain-containing protein n=1 Tax=Thalassobacterium sedimentorum TaxID=3041258 RepID=A0ABU1AFZ6_9BACT|nr:ATP-binding cassette domain-containing protein [Coraliomargarita sp. SDUM461004]MDQ8193597.1 ATP-binding cassette domain-containing protein [Coraliomargarita sp. SDUM461004]